MKIGVVARCDQRGLANQTWEVARHVPYEKILVVRDPGSERQGFKPDVDRFPDAEVAMFDFDNGTFNIQQIRDWLSGLDVVYSAETFYDWRMVQWAREQKVATVVHINPEFYCHPTRHFPNPTMWWNPTTWRMGHLAKGTRHVPMPVPVDRFPVPDFTSNPRRVLHVGGLPANGDRNGTLGVYEAANRLTDIEVVVAGQNLPNPRQSRAKLIQHTENYWDIYQGGYPLMVMPRKWGGLCLPVIEALGAGMAVAMTDCAPNHEWPVHPLPAREARTALQTPGGSISLHDVRWRTLVEEVQNLFDSGKLQDMREDSYAWALEHSWEALLGTWMEQLELAWMKSRGK